MSQINVDRVKNRIGTGSPTFTNGIIVSGVGTFSSHVSIAGTLTYEDVSNVDSVGVITAREGIRIGAGKSIGSDGAAVVYYGDGANLTNVGVDTATVDASTLQVSGISTFTGVVNASSDVRVTGNLNAGITTTSSIINGTALSHRNKIINGAMIIAQRGTSSTAIGIKTVDRWDTHASGMDQLAFTQKQVTDSPDGFSNSYEIDITTAESAQAGDEYMRIQQKIEAQDLQYLSYGTSSAKNVTVSFWVKAYQTGDYVVNFYAQDGNRQITRTYTVNASATWEYKSVTIPGDTSGTITNDTGAGLHLAFIVIADSGYRTTDSTSWINYTDGGYGYGQTVNLGSSTNNYWKITGVQLEAGPVATPFEHRSYGEELTRCERYYQLIAPPVAEALIAATQDYDNYTYFTVDLHTIMRANPTLVVSDFTNAFRLYGTNPRNVDTLSANTGVTTPSKIQLYASGGSSGAVGFARVFTADSGVYATIAVNSEI